MATTSGRLPHRRLRHRLSNESYPLWEPLLAIARNVGVGVTGTRGVGKSTLLFLLAWLDAIVYDKPLVAILPISQVFDLFATQLALLHPKDQAAIWPKIRYVPLAGYPVVPGSPVTDWYVLPTGLYAPTGLGAEDPFEVSQRLPETLLKLEPNLAEATVQGYKAVWKTSTQAGRILVTLGLGVTDMADMLTRIDTPLWQGRLDAAVRQDPSVADAVAYFRNEYAAWTPGRRDERTHALMTRLSTFAAPLMQAQFGPSFWTVPWTDVFEQKLKVFVDISHEHADATRAFKMLFVFLSLVDAIKRHGAAHAGDRSRPVSVIIDEIGVMVGGKNSPMAADLDAFINTYSRNYNVHFVTSFQEPYQIEDPKILDTLLSLGTKFFARMTDPTSARLIADRAIPYDPYEVKEVVYHRVGGMRGWDEPRNVYFSKQEQVELGRQRFDNLEALEFLVSRTVKEGAKPLPLHPYSLRAFRLRHPDPACVADVKRRLVLRDGLRVKDVLAQLAGPDPGEPQGETPPDDGRLETDF
jgi:hypothetical protein